MVRLSFAAATALVLAFLALAFVVLPVRDAASQATPVAQPMWTPSPDCVRLDALRTAHQKAHRPPTREEWQEFQELEARVGVDGCEREAEAFAPATVQGRVGTAQDTQRAGREGGPPDANLGPLASTEKGAPVNGGENEKPYIHFAVAGGRRSGLRL